MRTDSFSKEKHLPVRRFIADESKIATGLYGPVAIAEDLDNLHAMFDPEADILSGTQKGGISEKNLQDGAVSYDKLSPELREQLDELTDETEGLNEKVNLLHENKQSVGSTALKTESKNIVNAINELHDKKLDRESIADWAKQQEKPKYTADEVEMADGVPIREEFASINKHLNDVDTALDDRVDYATFHGETGILVDRHLKDIDYSYEFENDYFKETGTVLGAIAENRRKLSEKAEKSEISDLQASKQEKEDSALKTEHKTIVGAINELHSAKQNKETVLEEFVVDTPVWENQPSVASTGFQLLTFEDMTEETLGTVFTLTDFYYVTLKDVDGNDLPDGLFMLKHFYSDTTPINSRVFTFEADNRNTGTQTGVLAENDPVEFVESDGAWKLRHAGATNNWFYPNKTLDKDFGKLRMEAVGSVIPLGSNAYPLLIGYTSAPISNFHGGHATIYQSDSTINIGEYLPLTYATAWKHCVYRDSFTIEALDNEVFLTERTTSIRHAKYDGTGYNVISKHASGAGTVLTNGTFLDKLNCAASSGVVKNGTRVRITEVN